MRLLVSTLLAGLCAACLPSPRGHCASDADCKGGPAGLFCADQVCQSPPMFHANVPRAVGQRADVVAVRVQVTSAHGGPALATGVLEAGGTALPAVREASATLRFDVPLALAPAGTEGTLPLHVTIADDLGHQSALDDALSYDDAPPALALVPDAAWHGRADLAVHATVRDLTLDESSVRLAVGGASLAPSASSGADRTFTVPLSALPAGAEGPVPLSLTASDQLGHQGFATGQLLLDDKPPRASLDPASVPSAAVVRGSVVALRVLVDDASPLQVTSSLAGHPATMARQIDARTFEVSFDSSTLEPEKAQAALSIRIVDAAGNTTPIPVSLDVTRLKWHVPLTNPSTLKGMSLDNTLVVVTTDDAQLYRFAKSAGAPVTPVNLRATTTGAPVTSGTISYIALTDNSVCKVGTTVHWCCGPFGTLDSPMAFGPMQSSTGLSDTILVGSTGDPNAGGQRLFAVREDSQDSSVCHFFASSPVRSFEQTAPAIALDSTILMTLADSIVAARFDGFSWTTQINTFLNHSYSGFPALGLPGLQGQPLIAGTGTGFVEEAIFPISSDPSALPGNPVAGAGFSTSVASASFAASGATIAADGTIIVGTDDHRLVALDAMGHQKWQLGLNGKPSGPPTQGAGGVAYAADATGTLTAVNVADGSVRWTFAAAGALKVPPALGCDGTLYLGSDDGSVYALVSDSLGLADSPWPRLGRDNRGTGDARRKLRGPDGSCLD